MPDIDAALQETLRNTRNYDDTKNRDELISFVTHFNSSILQRFGADALDFSDYLIVPEGDYTLSTFELLWRICADNLDKKFYNNSRRKTECLALRADPSHLKDTLKECKPVKQDSHAKNLDSTSVHMKTKVPPDYYSYARIPRRGELCSRSDATPHGAQSSSLCASGERPKATVTIKICQEIAVTGSGFPVTENDHVEGRSENHSFLTNNDVNVDHSLTIQLPVHETITSENVAHGPKLADNQICVENYIPKEMEHNDLKTRSCPKNKLFSSIEDVSFPLVNDSSSVLTNVRYRSSISCKHSSGHDTSCVTKITNVTPFRDNCLKSSQVSLTSNKLFDDYFYANDEITKSISMCYVGGRNCKENDTARMNGILGKCMSIFFDITGAISLCSLDTASLREHSSENLRITPGMDERENYVHNRRISSYYAKHNHSSDIHNVSEIFGTTLSCIPTSLQQLTNGYTLLDNLVRFLHSMMSNTMYTKLRSLLLLTTLSLPTKLRTSKTILEHLHLWPTLKRRLYFKWKYDHFVRA